MGGKSTFMSKYWLLIICFIFVSSALVISSPALAQDDVEEFTLEEIVVTGSRIARNNNESTSPIVTVDEDLFDASSTSAIETQLNKLPQFTPTIDVPQVAGQDIQPTATNTPGEATVALRGIGANRTLVLINGRRGTPSNANGVLDINTIPSSAIQYVEAISGGASSTYGADAMAGVLNFIMKDRFEGFEVDISYSTTQEWDNDEAQISTVMGTNFADDRGNIMLALQYNNREGAKQGNRSWFRDNWRNPEISGNMFFPPASGYNIWYGPNNPDPAVLNDVMDLPAGQGFPTDGTFNPGGMLVWADQATGEVYTGFGSTASIPGIPAAEALGIVDGYEVKLQNNGVLGQNNVEAYLIFPLERYNFYTQGNYEINDYVGVFGQAYFSRTMAKTIQEPGIITSGWSVLIDPSINRESIPAELLAVLDSRAVDPDEPFRLQALLPKNRIGNTDTFTFNMTTGLEGEIPGIEWTWEAFVSHGEAETTSLMEGFYSLERMRTVMQSPEFGRGGEWTANEGAPDYNFGAATGTCESGLNPFDWDSVTQDCWDAVEGSVKSKQLMEQNIYEANTQGAIMELPGGEMRGAFGLSFRENRYYFQSDNLNTQGRSINDQVLGLYPAGESDGRITAKEAYAELLIPVLKDLPLAKQVNLELGGRRSDYNTTGVSYTYKAQFDWSASSFLRFRGGYNRAERAPNIAELYLARTSSFGVMSYGDACSMDNDLLAYSADPTINERNPLVDDAANPDWYDAVALCGQLMEGGNAASLADSEYYGFDWREIVDYAEANGGAVLPGMLDPNPDSFSGENYVQTQPDGGFGFIWPIDVGNPALSPEVADTWTFGFVLDSFVDDIPALMDWRISLDYYTIEIEDAIGLQTGDVVIQQCMDPIFNPDGDPNSPFCEGFNRNIDSGAVSTIERSYFNNGAFKTSGIDLQINWGMEAGPGRVSVSTLVNYLLEMESTELAGVNPMVDYVGTYGPSGNGLNGNSFEFRALTTLTYSMDKWDASLRWQHLDGLESVTPTDNTPLPSYNMFDLLGNYQLKDNVRIRFGIENLFDKAPKLYNRNYTDSDGMYGGSFSTQLHDVVGRRFYVGTKVYF